MPEITTVSECDCSICVKKGYLFVFTGVAKNFTMVKGSLDDMVTYKFGGNNLEHKVRWILIGGDVLAMVRVANDGYRIVLPGLCYGACGDLSSRGTA